MRAAQVAATKWISGLYGMVDVPGIEEQAANILPGSGESKTPLERAEELTLALVRGGAKVIQLRMKQSAAGELETFARKLLPIARAAGRPFIVNDRLDVALAVGADGVHLGQDDLPLAEAQKVVWETLGNECRFVIGISTHTLDQVKAATLGGADYLGFGPVFPTYSKSQPDPVVGLSLLQSACQASIPAPVVAIGGIGLEETAECARVGASAVAVIRYINRAPDVELAARTISHTFSAGWL